MLESPIGRRIQRLRRTAGLSVRALAIKAGMDRTHVHHLESGSRRNPTVETLARLCKGLGLTVQEFWEK